MNRFTSLLCISFLFFTANSFGQSHSKYGKVAATITVTNNDDKNDSKTVSIPELALTPQKEFEFEVPISVNGQQLICEANVFDIVS